MNSSGVNVAMYYGDSTTGTNASGIIAYDSATIAGITIGNQPFVAVDRTTNPTVKSNAAGIFGLGFPSGSAVQDALVVAESDYSTDTTAFVQRTTDYAPTVARMVMTEQLESPMFAVELQRNTIDVGGGSGVLTVGRLPDGLESSSLTWVPVRLYYPDEGGLSAPSFAENEVYPL